MLHYHNWLYYGLLLINSIYQHFLHTVNGAMQCVITIECSVKSSGMILDLCVCVHVIGLCLFYMLVLVVFCVSIAAAFPVYKNTCTFIC